MRRSIPPCFRAAVTFLLALACAWAAPLTAAPPEGTRSPESLATFDACWKRVRSSFYDPKLRGVDWERVRDRYRPCAAVTPTGRPLRTLLREMVAELGTSHTTVLHPEVYRSLKAELDNRWASTFGVLIEETEKGFYFVRRLYEGGPGERAGLRSGDRIVLVDGVSPDRSPRILDAGYDPALPGPPLFWILRDGPVELLLQPEIDPGSRRKITLEPIHMNAVDAARNSVQVVEREPHRIGFIHLWYCSAGVSRLLRESVRTTFRNCDALVVDLRGRGGHPQVVRELLAVFRARDRLFDRVLGRSRRPLWTKPVVFLVDERTRSAKEVLAHVIKEEALGTVVGRRTEGAVLGARFFPLPDGSVLEIPTTRYLTRGQPLEGIGVDPHVPVSFRLPFAGGEDPIREMGYRVAVRGIEARQAAR